MIEFDGYLTGAAKKHYQKKNLRTGRVIILASLALFFPGIIVFGVVAHFWLIVQIYLAIVVAFILVIFSPVSKKNVQEYIPKKILTDGESITVFGDKYVETQYIEDVKQVVDYGEFYDLVFPFGKINDKFVCQKELLVKGTFEEFEALFEGKMVKR